MSARGQNKTGRGFYAFFIENYLLITPLKPITMIDFTMGFSNYVELGEGEGKAT